MSNTSRKQYGGAKLNTIIAFVIIAALVVAGIRIVPVYITAYAYRDFIRTKARLADVNRQPVNVIQDEIYKKAQQLEIPVERSQISVEKVSGGVRIQSSFALPVDLVVMHRDFHFNFVEDTRNAY